MSRQLWDRVKASKFFYIKTYRWTGSLLVISCALNVLFLIWVFIMQLTAGEPSFYATSGITSPIELTPLTLPNYSAEPLLPNDPVNNESERPIPN